MFNRHSYKRHYPTRLNSVNHFSNYTIHIQPFTNIFRSTIQRIHLNLPFDQHYSTTSSFIQISNTFSMKKLLILNYHKLLSANTVDPNESKFSVQKNAFIQQLDLLKRLELPIISLKQLKSPENNSKISIILTFDDGNNSDYEIAYPILKERNITATFFPVISTIGTKNHITWEQLNQLSENGFTIGSHTVSHLDLTKSNQKDIEIELCESKNILEETLSTEIESLAFPFGKSTPSIELIARELGYKNALSTKGGTSSQNDFVLHRWNIKSTTSILEFESIIRGNKWVYFAKMTRSNLKKNAENIFGKGIQKSTQVKN